MKTGLGEFIDNLEIIDSHEHLTGCEQDYLAQDRDILQEIFCSYPAGDLLSSGMDEKSIQTVLAKESPLTERWSLLEPYWERIKFTGYGQMVMEGIRGVLDAELGVDPIQEIDKRFLESIAKSPYKEIIKDKCKIKTALLDKIVPNIELGNRINIMDSGMKVDDNYFHPVYHLDNFILPEIYQDMYFLESRQKKQISKLDDWVECCRESCRDAAARGAVGFKLTLAYKRSLDFPYTSKADAERSFQKVIENKVDVKWEPRAIGVDETFQNYMLFEILNVVKESGLPLQVHTGLQAGNANILANSNPLLLNKLFIQFPAVRFILLHMGIPFQQEAAMLTKMFPNVYLDACWAHIISPRATIAAMEEWVESLPVNKVIAFGGDLPSVICLCGHQKIARNNLTRALENKIAGGLLGEKDANRIAKAWFFDNPKDIFNL